MKLSECEDTMIGAEARLATSIKGVSLQISRVAHAQEVLFCPIVQERAALHADQARRWVTIRAWQCRI